MTEFLTLIKVYLSTVLFNLIFQYFYEEHKCMTSMKAQDQIEQTSFSFNKTDIEMGNLKTDL